MSPPDELCHMMSVSLGGKQLEACQEAGIKAIKGKLASLPFGVCVVAGFFSSNMCALCFFTLCFSGPLLTLSRNIFTVYTYNSHVTVYTLLISNYIYTHPNSFKKQNKHLPDSNIKKKSFQTALQETREKNIKKKHEQKT